MYKSIQIVEFLVEYNFKLTNDDIKNLKSVIDIMKSSKELNLFNFIYEADFVHKRHIEEIDKKIDEVNLMIDKCLETDIDELNVLRGYIESLEDLKEEILMEFNDKLNNFDKSREEKKLIDDCIVSIANGKSELFKMGDHESCSDFELMGIKYGINVNLLDMIFEILEDKELVNEIKVNLALKKEKEQIKDKLLLYKLINNNNEVISLYKEKKNLLVPLKNNIKTIRKKLEFAREREASLSGRIINYFCNNDNKPIGLELSLEEMSKTLGELEQEMKDIIDNVSDEKLKAILLNISFYSSDFEANKSDIFELEERLGKISKIKCSERARKLIDENTNLCEMVLYLSSKKQKNNRTSIISFYILKSLSDFYKNKLNDSEDKELENRFKNIINEINDRNEFKLKRFSNINTSVNKKIKGMKYTRRKHST